MENTKTEDIISAERLKSLEEKVQELKSITRWLEYKVKNIENNRNNKR